MAPVSVRAARGATSSVPSAPSSDSDSGCALEEYTDLQSCTKAGMLSLSSNDAKDLKFIQTLLKLLPPQDCDERFFTALSAKERRELNRFVAHRRLHYMRQGLIVPVTAETPERCCVRCNRRIVAGDTAVRSERLQDEGHWWHIGCFICETCHLPLLHFIYFLQDGRIYCGRHHAELTRPRCAACDQLFQTLAYQLLMAYIFHSLNVIDGQRIMRIVGLDLQLSKLDMFTSALERELILSEQCIRAEGHHWHMDHFRCWECDVVLGGSRYVMKGGRPFCGDCFLHLHAESCEACGDPIDPDGDLVTVRGQYWHSLPSCFCCSSCRVPLHLKEFTVNDGSLFCSRNCSPSSPQTHSPTLSPLLGNPLTGTLPISSSLNCTHQDQSVSPDGNNCNRSLQDPSSTCCTQDPNLHMGNEIRHIKGSYRLMEEDEDTSCSSSDSEPEGFFLGSPIPNFCISKANTSPVCDKNNGILKRRDRGKSCKVS